MTAALCAAATVDCKVQSQTVPTAPKQSRDPATGAPRKSDFYVSQRGGSDQEWDQDRLCIKCKSLMLATCCCARARSAGSFMCGDFFGHSSKMTTPGLLYLPELTLFVCYDIHKNYVDSFLFSSVRLEKSAILLFSVSQYTNTQCNRVQRRAAEQQSHSHHNRGHRLAQSL